MPEATASTSVETAASFSKASERRLKRPRTHGVVHRLSKPQPLQSSGSELNLLVAKSTPFSSILKRATKAFDSGKYTQVNIRAMGSQITRASTAALAVCDSQRCNIHCYTGTIALDDEVVPPTESPSPSEPVLQTRCKSAVVYVLSAKGASITRPSIASRDNVSL